MMTGPEPSYAHTMNPSNFAKLQRASGRISDAISEVMGCGLPFNDVREAFEHLSIALKSVSYIIPQVKVVASRGRNEDNDESANACTEPEITRLPPVVSKIDVTNVKELGEGIQVYTGDFHDLDNPGPSVLGPAELLRQKLAAVKQK